MRNDRQRTQASLSPLGVRNLVWVIVVASALISIAIMTLSRSRSLKDTATIGQSSGPSEYAPSSTPRSASTSATDYRDHIQVQHRDSPVPKADLDAAVNAIIRKFTNGGKDAEVAKESLAMISGLPPLPRASCMLMALMSNHRVGNNAQAKELLLRLNREFSGWDLPGLPVEAVDLAVIESKDVEPILTTLRSMSLLQDTSQQEQDAIKSLVRQYTERKAQYQNTTR